MNNQNSGRKLVGLLADLGPGLRNIAADALVEISEPLVPILTDALESHDPQMRKMAAVALCRIDPSRFLDLIRAYMEQDILSLHTNNVRQMVLEDCLNLPSIALLQKMLRERNLQTSSDLFYLLGAVYDAETVESVRHSLDSEDEATRLQAIKDLEALTEPTMAARIGELFDREMTPEHVLMVSAERSGISADIHDVMLELAKNHDEPWLRASALYTFGEIFAKGVQAEEGLASTLETSVKRARGLKSSQFRFDALTDDADTTAGKKSTRPLEKLNSLFGGEETKTLPQGSSSPDPEKTKPLPGGSGSSGGEGSPTLVGGATLTPGSANPKCQSHFSRAEVESVIGFALRDDYADVRCAARAAKRLMEGISVVNVQVQDGENRLPGIERMIALSKVEFFDGLNADNLRLLASVCDEVIYPADAVIVNEGDPVGALYVVVNGKVRLERGGARKDTSTLLATIEPGGTFGELTLFDNSPHNATALTSQPTLVLKLAQEPLLAIVRQHPELSLQLVTVLTQRVRSLYDKIADRTPSKSRMIHKIYDQLD